MYDYITTNFLFGQRVQEQWLHQGKKKRPVMQYNI